MPYGYLGQTPNQQVKNSGVFSVGDVKALTDVGQLGGSLELIKKQTASSSSELIFDDIKEDIYDVHFLSVENYQPSGNGIELMMRFYENGVKESSSVYLMAYQYGATSNLGFNTSVSAGFSRLRACFSAGNGTGVSGNAYNYLYNLGNSSKFSYQTMQTTLMNQTPACLMAFGGGMLPQASVVDGISLAPLSGTFSADVKLYGVKQWVT